MRNAALAGLLTLAACGATKTADERADATAGRGLERAAVAAGLVPAATDPVGLYASDTDRVCLVAAGGGHRIGVAVDYGPDHRCAATGTARGSRVLTIALRDGCSFDARFDGNRIVFPAVLPAACDQACVGRASLAAVEAERVSASPAEAATMTDNNGRPLCAT